RLAVVQPTSDAGRAGRRRLSRAHRRLHSGHAVDPVLQAEALRAAYALDVSRRIRAVPTELHYDRCPKCAHAPMPAQQALPAACPGCGIILAKVAANEQQSQSPKSSFSDFDEQPRFLARLLALVTHVPEQVSSPALI